MEIINLKASAGLSIKFLSILHPVKQPQNTSRLLTLIAFTFVLASCQKNLDVTSTKDGAVVSDDALVPLKYHATSFATNYAPYAFKFVKSLYPDNRVAKMTMYSRQFPNYYCFPRDHEYCRTDSRFSYSTNFATLTQSDSGLVEKGQQYYWGWARPDTEYGITFNKYGYCTSITLLPYKDTIMRLDYDANRLKGLYAIWQDPYGQGGGAMWHDYYYDVATDANGNVTQIKNRLDPHDQYNKTVVTINYTYNLAKKGNYQYQPTQYLINQWFTLLEVMQWVPMQVNERKSVSFTFSNYQFPESSAVYNFKQGQTYYNHKYDANGNLVSYTYGDNILQKITWK